MKYGKKDAKAHAREHMKGIWAAALTPFTLDLAIDETGLRDNIRHWTGELGIDGLFICGKQGEFFSMSLSERKRTFEIAVDEAQKTKFSTIMSCSDPFFLSSSTRLEPPAFSRYAASTSTTPSSKISFSAMFISMTSKPSW